MKIILHMAVSADGFIAKPDGDSDWVSSIDSDLFIERINKSGCVIVGRKTFDQYKGSLYPVKNASNIVLTKNSVPTAEEEDVFFVNSPEQAVELARKQGHESVILAGGGHVNGSFLNAGLIDEIFLSVHPIILNDGIRVFEGVKNSLQMKLLDTKEIGEGLVELHYAVS